MEDDMALIDDSFRLPGAPSECSMKSKARIDALFGDSRSVSSSTIGGWYSEVNLPISGSNVDEVSAEKQRRVNNAVQARIEAMFASIEAETGLPGEFVAAILPVRYLGAAPVGGRVASIRGLQEPLRDLLGRLEESLPAELEVSRRGLTFRTSESLEKTNPFRRIAVWSALKLRSKILPTGALHHAFLPLVGDEVSSTGDDKHADLYRTMKGLKRETKFNPPIFAVIMRRPGADRILECHAFVCKVEEDAIAAAATLYRALLADLDVNRRRPRHTNGVGCASLASVASMESNILQPAIFKKQFLGVAPSRPTSPHPIRPPRFKKSSRSSTKDDGNSDSSGQENGLRSSCTTIDIKEEDILEGRSRTSSLAFGPTLPIIKSLEEFQTKTSTRQDITSEQIPQDSNYSRSGNYYNKTIISVAESQQVKTQQSHRLAKEKQNHYGTSTNKRNSELHWPSVSGDDSNYEKIALLLDDKSDTKHLKENPIYGTQDGLDKIMGGKQQKYCVAKNHGIQSYEKSHNLNENRHDIHSSKRSDYPAINRTNHLKRDVSTYNQGQTDDMYNRKKSGGYTSQNQLFKEDPDEILSFDQNGYTAPKSRSSTSGRNSSYQTSTDDQPKSRVSRRISASNQSLKAASNEKLSANTPEYAQPKNGRGSRAGSEPPRIRDSEDDEAFAGSRQENRLKKAQSDLDLDSGDLMTRVELPRRGSFLNSTSARKPPSFQGRTPLGFTELFDEFRNHEGLTSVDDILTAIIDPEGMSFNDLKPLYKEFLLKLATTLTRDELYARSASIMRRRRQPQRQPSRRSCFFGRAIKRSVSRFKNGPTEFTSIIFPAGKLNDSIGSSSSGDAKAHRNRVLGSRLGRKRSSWRRARHTFGHTTSEDSDTCRRPRRITTANRSSSGYVSCSECSYDSESCTCISAEKCYCSLSRREQAPPVPVTTVLCSCDTDSCSESNKCYCARKLPVRHPTILEQLRQRGIVPSESTLSRTASPQMVRDLRTTKSHASSRSLEFLKVRPNAGTCDNLALDYELFSPGRRYRRAASKHDKVLVVGARDSQGRIIYVGGTERAKKSDTTGSRRSNDHHEALSIKKSAEIAAVFANSAKIGRRTSSVSSLKSSESLEAGLGYLP